MLIVQLNKASLGIIKKTLLIGEQRASIHSAVKPAVQLLQSQEVHPGATLQFFPTLSRSSFTQRPEDRAILLLYSRSSPIGVCIPSILPW